MENHVAKRWQKSIFPANFTPSSLPNFELLVSKANSTTSSSAFTKHFFQETMNDEERFLLGKKMETILVIVFLRLDFAIFWVKFN